MSKRIIKKLQSWATLSIYSNWSDSSKALLEAMAVSTSAFSFALGTVITQYAVSEWIWNSKRDRHASPVFLVSLLVFWVLWSLVYSNMALSGQPATGVYVVTFVLAFGGFAFNLAFLWMSSRLQKSDESSTDEPIALTGPSERRSTSLTRPLLEEEMPSEPPVDIEMPSRSKARPGKRATVDWINNVKIFLTNVVILHHCASPFGWWPGLANMTNDPSNWGTIFLNLFLSINDSYFMSLFFFYSGYFVPKSYDKKGRYEFLFDRAKRLGIPYVVYMYFLGPYVEFGFMKLFFDTPYPSGTTGTGPTWFLNQLIIFSIVYSLACGTAWSPSVACPSLAGFFGIGIVIGVITGVIILFTPGQGGGSYFGVPRFWISYLSYVVFFFGGALAQRNDWMESIKAKSRAVIYAWAILSIALLLTLWILHSKGMIAPPLWGHLLLVQGVLQYGIISMGVSLAVSVFFMDYVNGKYFLTPFFSKAMYTAYIIQLVFPVLAALKCVALILQASGNIAYQDGQEPSVNTAYIVNANLIVPSWLLVCTIATLIVWPMAHAIRSIPGFSQVL